MIKTKNIKPSHSSRDSIKAIAETSSLKNTMVNEILFNYTQTHLNNHKKTTSNHHMFSLRRFVSSGM